MEKEKVSFKDHVRRITQSRIPLVLVFILLTVAVILLGVNSEKLNKPVNAQLRHRRIVRISNMHHDQNKIFKYRAQLEATSDQHMIYLLHHPKLKNHPQYIKLTTTMMRTNDIDNERIHVLENDADNDRKDIKRDHNKRASTNAMQPINTKASDSLVSNAVTMILVVFVDLIDLVKIVKFKDTLRKRKLEG